MPLVGFGCAFGNWTNSLTGETGFEGFCPDQAWEPLATALRVGYRHFDAAYVYGTHRHLGSVLGSGFMRGLKRSELFITTKVFHPPGSIALNHIGKTMDMTDPALDVRKRTHIDFEHSLDEMGLGYVDLLLMHWPGAFGSKDAELNRRLRKECWESMEEILKSGKARAIGVSNFQKHHLETLIADTTVVPMVNQIEISPYITNADLQAFCREKGIVLQAWAPLGSGATGVLKDPVIAEIAEAQGKSVGQVILRWLVQQGICVLPKSSNEKRMRENLEVFDFELSPEQMQRLGSLNRNLSSVGAKPVEIA